MGLNKILKNRWENLKGWKKGALLGAFFHIFAVLLIIPTFFLIGPNLPTRGFQEAFSVILFSLYSLLELIPGLIFSLLTGIKNVIEPRNNWTLVFFLLFSTAFYGLVGACISLLFEKKDAGQLSK